MENVITLKNLVHIAMDNRDVGPDRAMGNRGKAFHALGGGIDFEINDGDRDEFVRRGFEFLDDFQRHAEEAISTEMENDEPNDEVKKIIQDIALFVEAVKANHLAEYFVCLIEEFDGCHPRDNE